LNEPFQLRDEPVGIHGEAEEFRELTDQDRQREAVHVADLRRLREQVGDESEFRGSGQQHDRPDEDREHRRERDRLRWITIGADERQDRRCDHRTERGIGPEDEDLRRTHDRVADQAEDRGVETGDRGETGELRVRHPLRHQQGRQYESGDHVLGQPGPLVGPEQPEAGHRCQFHPASSLVPAAGSDRSLP
jgi:hypothetical protein